MRVNFAPSGRSPARFGREAAKVPGPSPWPPSSACSEWSRWGPVCQRRLSVLGSPPSPRTLTAKPNLTQPLRPDRPPGPGVPLLAALARRRHGLGPLALGRVGGLLDRVVDLRLLRAASLAGLGRLTQLGLGLFLALGLAAAGFGDRTLFL